MYVCEKLFLLFHRFNFIIQVFQKQEENKTMENSKSSYVKIINEKELSLAAIPMTGHFV